ncbi:MAG: potassium channel family protein [Pirellulales bacterium]|nr:potassium channel family protein [Pirellulales bacterium]
MLNSILVGLLLTAMTIAIHATGTALWIRYLKRNERQSAGGRRASSHLRVLCATAIALLSLHIVEVVVWALTYRILVGRQAFATIEEAIYFSTVTFASLGYGDVVIDGPWRLLSAIQAMIGLLVFGWSSALLFAVVQRILRIEDQSPKGPDQEASSGL